MQKLNLIFFFNRQMASPPPSPPASRATSPPACPPPPSVKRTRQATRLKKLTVRHMAGDKLVVSVDPNTGKISGPHHTQFRSYLGTLAREKVCNFLEFLTCYAYMVSICKWIDI